MKYMWQWVMVAVMLLGSAVQGAWDADKMFDKILQVGSDVLAAEQERRKAVQEPQGATAASQDEQNTVAEALPARLAHMVSGSVDVLLAEYKEAGRVYARELGDLLVERVRQDPQIQSSIRSVQMLCWGVIIYLTLVTIVMLGSLLHLKKVNRRLLEAVQDMQKRLPGH